MHTESSRKLQCCGRTFLTKSNLRDHLKTFHKNGYDCYICGRLFQRKALLTRHLTVHGGRKEYRCPFCNYETSHKSNLERHKKIHGKKQTSYVGRKRTSNKDKGLCNEFKPIDTVSLRNGQISLHMDQQKIEKYTYLNNRYAPFKNVQGYIQHKPAGNYWLYSDVDYFMRSQTLYDAPKTSAVPPAWYKSAFKCHMNTDNPYEAEENSDLYVQWMLRSPKFRSNEDCLGCDIDSGGLGSFVNKKNDIIRQKNLAGREENGNQAEKVRTDPQMSSRMKQPRLCYFPYKCNFCNARFGSQHELCCHGDVCM